MTLTDPLFLAQLVKTAELNPNKNYILGSHPHGIMCFGAFACFSTTSCGFTELFPGLRSSLVVLAGLFKIPLFREYLMGAGIHQLFKEAELLCFNLKSHLCLVKTD